MSAIFISHSSKDNEFCEKLMAWLDDLGHRSVFLDIDASSGIAAGYNWEQKLYQELRVCRAVIVVCTENLMNSKWCFAEITQARSLGKHIFPIKIAECKIDSVLSDSQVVDFLKFDEKEAFERLKQGLAIAGIDAKDPYDWDGSRSPYPGLLAFQEADAAIFFGRDKEIGDGLDVLNGIHRYGGSGLVMTLGASGSGKSSLIRAGIVPRLKRDPARWLVIDPFQPGEDPFFELAKVLSTAYRKYTKTKQKANAIRDSLMINKVSIEQTNNTEDENNRVLKEETVLGLEDLHEAIKTLESLLQNSAIGTGKSKHALLRSGLRDLQKLRNEFATLNEVDNKDNDDDSCPEFIEELLNGSDRENASLLIIIDQFEELLNRPPDYLGSQFLAFLRRVLDNKDNKLVVIGTMRSDFLGAFQQNPALRSLDYGKILVGPVDTASLTEIIEKPAELGGVRIEPKLLQALIEDAGTDDALPLLAFTLRELYDKFTDDNFLEYREYKDFLGGIQGAVAKAAEDVLENPPLTQLQGENLRRAFLFMSRINENGQFTREVAKWSDMPTEVHGVLERLVEGRLLVSRGGENNDGTIEVAHETLFRSWKRLKTWLDEDREFLLWRSRLAKAKDAWDYNEQDKNALLKGAVLYEATNWFERYKDQLDQEEQIFVKASFQEDRRRRRKRRASIIGVISIIAMIGIFMTILFFRANEERIKGQALFQMSIAIETLEKDPEYALFLAKEAMKIDHELSDGSQYKKIKLLNIYYKLYSIDSIGITCYDLSPDLSNLITGSSKNEIKVWDINGVMVQNIKFDSDGRITSIKYSPDGKSIFVGSTDQTASIIGLEDGLKYMELLGHHDAVNSLTFSPNQKYLLTGSRDGTAKLWDINGSLIFEFFGHTSDIYSVAFSPVGDKILTGSYDKTVLLWNVLDGILEMRFDDIPYYSGHEVDFSYDGKTIIIKSENDVFFYDLSGNLKYFKPR